MLINYVLCEEKILRQLCPEDNTNKGSLLLVLLGCLQMWTRQKGQRFTPCASENTESVPDLGAGELRETSCHTPPFPLLLQSPSW